MFPNGQPLVAALADGIHDWLRTVHVRARIDSLIAALNTKISRDCSQPCLLYEFNQDGYVLTRSLSETPFSSQAVSENQRYLLTFDGLADGASIWAISLRDEVSNLGTLSGGKHAGQSIAADAVNWCDLQVYGSQSLSPALAGKGSDVVRPGSSGIFNFGWASHCYARIVFHLTGRADRSASAPVNVLCRRRSSGFGYFFTAPRRLSKSRPDSSAMSLQCSLMLLVCYKFKGEVMVRRSGRRNVRKRRSSGAALISEFGAVVCAIALLIVIPLVYLTLAACGVALTSLYAERSLVSASEAGTFEKAVAAVIAESAA